MLHLQTHLPRWDVFQHRHMCLFKALGDVWVQILWPSIIELSLNPMHKKSSSKELRDLQGENGTKQCVLKLDGIRIGQSAPFSQGIIESGASLLS
jgi:hypothetical protein